MRALFGRGEHPDSDQLVAAALAAGRRCWRRDVPGGSVSRSPPTTARQTVAGFDLVFTPVKSVSLLWALGDDAVRRAVEEAHHDAVADAIGWLERNAAFTRIGAGGALQVETHGLIAAAFDHRESRLGDPDLHTHVAVANKVRAVVDKAGRVTALAVAGRPHPVRGRGRRIGAVQHPTRGQPAPALGVRFVERADTVRRDARPVREIAGIPVALIKAFSRRRAEVERRYDELRRTYRVEHGHDAPAPHNSSWPSRPRSTPAKASRTATVLRTTRRVAHAQPRRCSATTTRSTHWSAT